MTGDLLSSGKNNRKLKIHKKSRRGCGNCKLRKVKCDESMPKCKKCVAYGVLCNYDSQCSELQLSAAGASRIDIEIPLRFSSRDQSIPSLFVPSLSQQWAGAQNTSFYYEPGGPGPDLLSRFQLMTVSTIAAPRVLDIFSDNIVRLAYPRPFLMHAVLSLSLMHDRAQSSSPHTKMSATEAFHFYQGVALLNRKLSKPINAFERDALFFAAHILSVVAFYYIEARNPEEAWPLRPASTMDLNWLSMSNGKTEIWRITATAGRVPSVFDKAPRDNMPEFLAAPDLDAVPSSFVSLYGLDNPTSSRATNPYHCAASSVAQFLPMADEATTMLAFIVFTGEMESGFKRLLDRKDARALLLLAYWFAMVSQVEIWWTRQRVAVECQAICLYLERYHWQEEVIRELMKFPRKLSEGVVMPISDMGKWWNATSPGSDTVRNQTFRGDLSL